MASFKIPDKSKVISPANCCVCGKPLALNRVAFTIWKGDPQAAANGGGGQLHVKCYTNPLKAARLAQAPPPPTEEPKPDPDPDDLWPLGKPSA